MPCGVGEKMNSYHVSISWRTGACLFDYVCNGEGDGGVSVVWLGGTVWLYIDVRVGAMGLECALEGAFTVSIEGFRGIVVCAVAEGGVVFG